MASSRIIVIFSLVATIISTGSLATEFTVGDQAGWSNKTDYKKWAEGKNFMVGDILVFNYPVGVHNVFKVNATQFQNCTVPPPNEALTTGHDEIELKISGKKWYICGFPKHCEEGQKLVIDVMENMTPAPAPNGGIKTTLSKLSMMIILAIVTLVIRA